MKRISQNFSSAFYLLASTASAALGGFVLTNNNLLGIALLGSSIILIGYFFYSFHDYAAAPGDTFLQLILRYATHDMLFVTNADGEILLMNHVARETLAITDEDHPLIDTVIKLYDDKNKLMPLKSELGQHTVTLNRHYTTHDQPHFVAVTIAATPPYFVIVMRDITNLRTLEKERHEFISVASHELRTPLTVADGWLSAVLKNKSIGEAEKEQYLQRTQSSLKHLKLIVNDLTTLSKAIQGVLEVEISHVDISAVLTNIFREYQPKAEAKGLTMTLDIAPAVRTVLTSEYRITEIVRNYVDNAVKFTKDGLITLNAEPTEHDGVLISVTDSGIGIPVGESDKLFATFYQKEGVETREVEGTGLGLYIVRQLAERLDAHFWFTSKEGQGSTFYIEVPKYSHHRENAQKTSSR